MAIANSYNRQLKAAVSDAERMLANKTDMLEIIGFYSTYGSDIGHYAIVQLIQRRDVGLRGIDLADFNYAASLVEDRALEDFFSRDEINGMMGHEKRVLKETIRRGLFFYG